MPEQGVGEHDDHPNWNEHLVIECCPVRDASQNAFQDLNDSAVDTLGALTGGELVNGTKEDFVPIESN